MTRALLLWLLLGLLPSCVRTTETHGIPNLSQVDPGVWRSGQPAGAEGWAYLKSLGVTRVVKLDFEHEASEDGARAVGIEIVYAAFEPDENLLHTVEAPDPGNVDLAVAELSKGGGVLFHCLHGQDRTGYVAGRYRVLHDHWSKTAAYHEMLGHGFHPELPGLQRAWDEFAPSESSKPSK